MHAEEFQEIYLSGGTIEKKVATGGASIGYRSAHPWPMGLFQACASFKGVILDRVALGGSCGGGRSGGPRGGWAVGVALSAHVQRRAQAAYSAGAAVPP